jgi:aminomethyltransferase
VIVARLGFSGELGYELLVHASDAPAFRQKLLDAGRGDGLRECSWTAADSLRIESGYVLFDREIDGCANPRELGLERLVDDKSMKFELRRKLVGVEILDGPARADLPPARVTSECLSPTLGKTIALAFTEPDYTAGSAVRLSDGRTARVATLPFYDPERRRPRAAPL